MMKELQCKLMLLILKLIWLGFNVRLSWYTLIIIGYRGLFDSKNH